MFQNTRNGACYFNHFQSLNCFNLFRNKWNVRQFSSFLVCFKVSKQVKQLNLLDLVNFQRFIFLYSLYVSMFHWNKMYALGLCGVFMQYMSDNASTIEKLPHWRVFHTDTVGFKNINCTDKVGPTVWPEQFHVTSNCDESPQRVNERWRAHLFYYFNMYSSGCKTGEEWSPSLTMSKTSPSTPEDSQSWTKGVHTYGWEGRARLKAVRRKISHLLYFVLPLKFRTFQALMNYGRDKPLTHYDPIPCSSHCTFCQVMTLVFNQDVIMSNE